MVKILVISFLSVFFQFSSFAHGDHEAAQEIHIPGNTRKEEMKSVSRYLDLSQDGVKGEFEEFLHLGHEEALEAAKKQGIAVGEGMAIQDEMMEGVLFVYGLEARQRDLIKRMVYLFFLTVVLLIFHKKRKGV